MSNLSPDGSMQQNVSGNWVPAIPLPIYLHFGRVKCSCGERFWSKRNYEGHYALMHILKAI